MAAPRLGLRANAAQFTLLVFVNGLVGAMVGMERSILPALAEEAFHLAARTAILSFIVAFGLAKAATNYVAGRLADRSGRRPVLIAGWLMALPVPFVLMWAPSWGWVLAANVLLGASQGLAWSTTIIMKIDLAGPARRGLAMGLNESAGYLAVALAAFATAAIAARTGLRPEPFFLGIGVAGLGLALSILAVRETRDHVTLEARPHASAGRPSEREIFRRTSFGDRSLSAASQAGLVNNLNDGLAWGLLPLVYAAAGMSLARIGVLAALYPAVWGIAQLGTGALSDHVGRKGLIVWGMWVQGAGIAVTTIAHAMMPFAIGAVLLGLGTAMVYPTLLAVVGDVAQPGWRGSAVGVYRLWRDLGYAVGAAIAGSIADAFGMGGALWAVAALTCLSGIVVAIRMRESRRTAA